jgi:Cof subfamily protein (haloacid dehalogenase superfamily)
MKIPEKKLNPKIIAFDLDDTLLNGDLVITPATVDAIRKAADRGIYIVLCSGRAENAILKYVRLLDIAGTQAGRYIIALNGAVVYDMHKRLVVYSRKVEGDVLLYAYREAQKYGLAGEVYNPSTIFVPENNEWTRIDAELSGLKLQVVDDFPALLNQGHSKMVIPGKPEVLQMLEKKLKEELGTSAVIFTSKPYFLEVMPPESGKGEALLWLAGELGIAQDKTMAFGDSMNDESMIRMAQYSVAMSNGLEYIRNIASYVTQRTNNEDGIADFLESFVL